MSENEKSLPNFKRLWNKKYADLVGHNLGTTAKTTPEEIFNLIVRYFEWAEENSIKAGETTAFQGRVYQDTVTKPRVFTLNSLLLFCGVSNATWARWKTTPGFDSVIEFAENVIREQKYQYAANGMINTAMIVKELGLDKGNALEGDNSQNTDDNTEEAMKNAVHSILSKI